MSEMVERVAEAIWESDTGYPWRDAGVKEKQRAREDAQAAIKAMMEPTEAMIEAMPETHYWGTCPSCGGSEGAYKAMLKAALND